MTHIHPTIWPSTYWLSWFNRWVNIFELLDVYYERPRHLQQSSRKTFSRYGDAKQYRSQLKRLAERFVEIPSKEAVKSCDKRKIKGGLRSLFNDVRKHLKLDEQEFTWATPRTTNNDDLVQRGKKTVETAVSPSEFIGPDSGDDHRKELETKEKILYGRKISETDNILTEHEVQLKDNLKKLFVKVNE